MICAYTRKQGQPWRYIQTTAPKIYSSVVGATHSLLRDAPHTLRHVRYAFG